MASKPRRQFIFNNKIESEQKRLTEKLNQLQVRLKSPKHSMEDDDIKKESEMRK